MIGISQLGIIDSQCLLYIIEYITYNLSDNIHYNDDIKDDTSIRNVMFTRRR